MSIAWMCVVAALILAQKLLRPRALIDVPLALTIVAFGVLVLVEPSAIPGLTPAM
jgi:predicted metal-binding membrane protein